ncbi:hypothetical protein BD560DRAFT_429783 [Blakeslea trispora]|nr:hypothetical protein BD560DRAFT_429783 [Blakeslea trispora]
MTLQRPDFFIELTDFLRDNSVVDYSLKEFVSKHEDFDCINKYIQFMDKLRATWVKRYKEALRKESKSAMLAKSILIEVDCLGARLFRWCEAKFKGEEFEGVKQVLEEISSLESKEGRSLKECLQVMTCKYLMTFDTLNHLSKCMLKYDCISMAEVLDHKSIQKLARIEGTNNDLRRRKEVERVKGPWLLMSPKSYMF